MMGCHEAIQEKFEMVAPHSCWIFLDICSCGYWKTYHIGNKRQNLYCISEVAFLCPCFLHPFWLIALSSDTWRGAIRLSRSKQSKRVAMAEDIGHECGFAMLRLLKPPEYYLEKCLGEMACKWRSVTCHLLDFVAAFLFPCLPYQGMVPTSSV